VNRSTHHAGGDPRHVLLYPNERKTYHQVAARFHAFDRYAMSGLIAARL
jgi:hypothetical protein